MTLCSGVTELNRDIKSNVTGKTSGVRKRQLSEILKVIFSWGRKCCLQVHSCALARATTVGLGDMRELGKNKHIHREKKYKNTHDLCVVLSCWGGVWVCYYLEKTLWLVYVYHVCLHCTAYKLPFNCCPWKFWLEWTCSKKAFAKCLHVKLKVGLKNTKIKVRNCSKSHSY